jgi:site-specific DNA recombinase
MPRVDRTKEEKKTKAAKTAAIYCRVSTRSQGETGLSLDHQETKCREYCSSHSWEIVNVYTEVASAKDLERPQVQQLLNDAKSNKFDVVVGLKLDRLSRVPKDFYNLFEDLSDMDVDLVVVEDQIDTTNAVGRMLMGILLQFAAFERELGIERTRAAMRELALQGKPGGGYPPIGYDRVNKQFVVNPDGALIIKRIFNRYLQGVGPTKIAAELNDLGFRTATRTRKDGTTIGGREFTKGRIHNIVSNPIYAGILFFRGEFLPGNHTPIIEKDIWDQAQLQVKANADRRNLGNSKYDRHLLNGLLKCGLCQNLMSVRGGTSQSKKTYSYYQCIQSTKGSKEKRCKNAPINTTNLEKIIVSLIKQIALSDEFFEAVSDEINTTIDKQEIGRLTAGLQNAAQQESKLTSKIKNLIGLLSENKTSNVDEISAEIDVITAERVGIQKRITEYQKNLEGANRTLPTAEELRAVYSEFTEVWESLSPAERRDAIRLLIYEIEITNPKKTEKGNIAVTLFHDIPALSLTEVTQGSHFSTVQLRRRDLNSQPSD